MNLPQHQLLGAGLACLFFLLPFDGYAAPKNGGGKDTTLTASATPVSATPIASAVDQRRARKAAPAAETPSSPNATPSAEAEPKPRVTFGRGIWGAGHAGLALPTSFAPGLGEIYTVPGLDQIPDSKLIVFDKSGKRVYFQYGYGGGWDGTDRDGKPLPAGTYFLMVEVDGLGDDVQAYVKLLR